MESLAGNITLWTLAVTAFATLVAALVAAAGGIRHVWAWGKWMQRQESFAETTKEDIKTINEALKELRADVKEEIKIVNEALKEVRADIKNIYSRLPSESLFRTGSPLLLTDSGKAVSEELGAEAWAKETASKVSGQIEDETPYGIQQFCFDYVKGESPDFPEDLIDRMKDSAFRRGIKMEEIKSVLAIELRDVLFNLRGLEAALQKSAE